jgi:NADPH:quinone reductase-like Zn-dependent oxidoreductase
MVPAAIAPGPSAVQTGGTAGRRLAGLSAEPDYPALEALADLAESGRLRVHLQAALGLAEAAKAHELLESGGVTGKIALTV